MTTLEEYEALSKEDKAKFWGDSLSVDTVGRLIHWAGHLKLPVSEVRDNFQTKLAALTVQLKDQNISEEQIERTARKQFANDIRPGRSRAGTFEGVVLGYGPLRDWNDFWFNIAKGAFNKEPMQARLDGVTDDNGLALVTSEIKEKKGQYFRQQVGELLKHEWERTVLAIGRAVVREEGDDAMRMFTIKLTGEPARFADPKKFPAPQIGQVSRWRCNVQEVNEEWNWIRANGATVTAFEPATVVTKGGPVSGMYEPKKCAHLLRQVKAAFTSSLEELGSWIDENARKAGMFAVIEGEILNMYQQSIRLGDADQLDLEDIPTMFVALDPAIPDQMFYGVNSSVIVACLPYRRKARERSDDGTYKTVEDEMGEAKMEVVANAIAIFPLIAMPKEVEVVPDIPEAAAANEEIPPEDGGEAPAEETIEL